MSRQDVLVDADWVAEHASRRERRPRRGRRGHLRLRQEPHQERDQASTGRRTSRTRSAVTSSTRSGFEKLLSAGASPTTTPSCSTAATTTGSPRTPTGTSSSTATQDVRLLDGGRKKWELDSRDLVERGAPRPATEYKAKAQDTSIRAFRDEVVAAIGDKNLVDVRSPDEFGGKLLAPAHLPAGAVAARPATSRPPATSRGRRRPTTTAPSSPTTSCKELYEDAGVDLGKDTIAYCRIGERSAHTWFVLHELLGQPQRQELRRLVDRVRLAGRRADRARRRARQA